MIKIYKTEESIVNEIEKVEDGCWINMITPTMEECISISECFDIDIADVRAALDDEESSRVDLEDGYTLILVDIPSIEIRHKQEAYTTIPLGIILADGVIITVCGEETRYCRRLKNGVCVIFPRRKKCVLSIRFFIVRPVFTRIICVSLTNVAGRLKNVSVTIPKIRI